MSAWTEARDRQMIADGWVKRPDGYWEQPKVKLGPNYGTAPTPLPPVPFKTMKRIRQSSKPLMNKLEEEWFGVLCSRPGYLVYAQSMRFKLGNGIWYKPDFVVFCETGMMAYEVKGPFAHRGGFENLKVAAHQYHARLHWFLVWKDKQTHEWCEQRILP